MYCSLVEYTSNVNLKYRQFCHLKICCQKRTWLLCIPALQHAWRKLKRPQQGEMKVGISLVFTCLTFLSCLSCLSGRPPGSASRSFGPVQVELHVTLVRRRRSALCWKNKIAGSCHSDSLQRIKILSHSPTVSHHGPHTHGCQSISILVMFCSQKILWFIGSLRREWIFLSTQMRLAPSSQGAVASINLS